MRNIDDIVALLVEQRKKLGIEQKDMYMRIGMKQQQYQRIESGSDVRLSTLLRVLEGLDLELLIVPRGRSAATLTTDSPRADRSDLSKRKDELEDDVDDLGFWFNSEDS